MRPEPLVAAFGKVEWAVTQIDQLNLQIKSFFADNPYSIVREIEPDGARIQPVEVWRLELSKPIPAPIYAQVSSILGSLREPLDQVVAAVKRHRSRSESGVGFVFGETRQEFETSLGESKKVPADVRDAIAAQEPFYGGRGALLAALHYVKNPDKHRSALVPMIAQAAMTQQFMAVMKGGRLLTIGPRKGRHLRPAPPHGHLQPPRPDLMPDFIPDRGFVYRSPLGVGPKDSMEIATMLPGTEMYTHFQAAFDIALGEISGVAGEAVVPALSQVRDLVEETLIAFERRFFS